MDIVINDQQGIQERILRKNIEEGIMSILHSDNEVVLAVDYKYNNYKKERNHLCLSKLIVHI